MFDAWDFANVPLNRPNVRVRNISGPYSLPPLRGSNVALSSRAGAIWLPKLHEPRHITLELLIFDPGGGEHELIRRTVEEFATLFARATQDTLTHYEPDGTIRTAQAQVEAFVPVDTSGIGIVWSCSVDFLLSDVYLYGPNITDAARAIPASPTTFTFTHPGIVRGMRITLDLLGPITNPRLTNVTNGIYVEALVTVAPGTHLVIDAVNAGANAIGSIRHSGSRELMFFEPKANLLSVTGSAMTGATALTTTFSPAYL
jgi:hypothetical protein